MLAKYEMLCYYPHKKLKEDEHCTLFIASHIKVQLSVAIAQPIRLLYIFLSIVFLSKTIKQFPSFIAPLLYNFRAPGFPSPTGSRSALSLVQFPEAICTIRRSSRHQIVGPSHPPHGFVRCS